MSKMKEAPAPKTKKAVTPKSTTTQEQIATRAYEIYLERGATPGNEFQDWIQAERELLGENGKAAPENGKSVVENGKARRKATVKSATA